MVILIVSGGFYRIVSGYLPDRLEAVQADALTLQDLPGYLQENNPAVDGVLLTDEAFSGSQEPDLGHLNAALNWFSDRRGAEVPVFLLTRNPLRSQQLEPLLQKYAGLRIVVCDEPRIPLGLIRSVLGELAAGRHGRSPKPQRAPVDTPVEEAKPEKKRSFFSRFRAKAEKGEAQPEATDPLTKRMAGISRGMSRVVAVTGHRGSGLTSTVVNLAHEASKRGLSTMIIDMDAEYRSMNMYFGRFHEQSNKYDEMSASLIRTLARPQDYMTTACSIKDNLWLTALGYSFQDHRLMDQFYTSDKLVGLLSLLRTKFNLVLLDMPLDLFREFRETMIHIDIFGLCVPNNLHAVLSTIRNVEVVLDAEKAAYLNAKSKVIVTKYNDRSRFQNALFAPERVGEVLASGLSECFRYEMNLAGHVPYNNGFDSQIETEIALTNLAPEYEQAFGHMLLRLMEGA
ncbi:hypothetical protein [Paenibacillus macerans]|uniref:CobQ/CobB/MinD/ParA nucleotide binding domain protein n=1 Tax=Paenibacillus macerans TaxID=44252 RepID=A0A090XG25_PAEMA|nr:hypothetical protein [Paenibacillus macerans]KFM83686.1 cobQ/CobB/MinD/ParA nucleotide binding domain protein [Paenibacillus macerans]MBS5914429.1 hypothetical protein [Paenibacillus macerans]MCY7559661.1 hypothetical protein [Paenibacillus macerans]MEC0149903.1 hypothetical protein [Paenibacillus macerans]SUA86215.1 Septum formation inhibitor-activating ATPase [Paenibacillus macerans]